MIKTNLPVLFIKNHEIFPFCETKLEFSDINLKKTVKQPLHSFNISASKL